MWIVEWETDDVVLYSKFDTEAAAQSFYEIKHEVLLRSDDNWTMQIYEEKEYGNETD